MSTDTLTRVLEATGYLVRGNPAHGVLLGENATRSRWGRRFQPDALWQSQSNLTVYFKYADVRPTDQEIQVWHQEVWNEGFAPLLWVISPDIIEIYNGFSRPNSANTADSHRLHSFKNIHEQLVALDDYAGRLAMETGQFLAQTKEVTKETSVDHELLQDLKALESRLVEANLRRSDAQGLIGRSIFTQYLVDRKIVDYQRLFKECGKTSLPDALCDRDSATRLFAWLADVFNGDMFPQTSELGSLKEQHLRLVADFLRATDRHGQTSLFPYQFDIIPVELISSIYEQFAHSSNGVDAENQGVHYTRLSVVSLILDEVLDTASGNESVLDLTCGSGVFLVEALRRLVKLKGGESPARELIRETLYSQIYGIDSSESAVHVAAFSLYLAALELDPDPQPPEALKFERLIGRTLLHGDAFTIEETPEGASLLQLDGALRKFDVIVGNPPWTFKGKKGTAERRIRRHGKLRAPRGVALDFVYRAMDFQHEKTRYGLVLSATQFFAASQTARDTVREILQAIKPVTLVNLSLHRKWLFPTAVMPAIILLARHRQQKPDQMTIVNVPWSPSSEKSHSIEVSPSDVSILSFAAWHDKPERLKASLYGNRRDIILLDNLKAKFGTLNEWLESVGTEWRDGLILGKVENRTRDARDLLGLNLLSAKDLNYFTVPGDLSPFEEPKAQWPRERGTYRAPILLVKEFLKRNPRPLVAIAKRDLLYTDAYFGASLSKDNYKSAQLISALLTSALGSWFFLLMASEFGIMKQRLFTSDVDMLPIPDPAEAIDTESGQKILKLTSKFQQEGFSSEEWSTLDKAVFDLYGLEPCDRIVVEDGLFRASWQWEKGRKESCAPANIEEDIKPYANVFMREIDVWLQATKSRKITAEVFNLPRNAPIRIIRFVLEDGRHKPSVKKVKPEADLSEIIKDIGSRLKVQIGQVLFGSRELRVHGTDEVIIIKPAARRFWMRSLALEDADIVISESIMGGTA